MRPVSFRVQYDFYPDTGAWVETKRGVTIEDLPTLSEVEYAALLRLVARFLQHGGEGLA